MSKLTRRVKKNRKNKTIKKGGDNSNHERKGIIDMVTDKISNVTYNVIDKAEDIGLNALGLEKIDKSNDTSVASVASNLPDMKIDENLEKIRDTASGVVSTVGNTVDKTSAAIIDNVNEVLGSTAVSQGVKEAGEETGAIIGKLSETFNDAMNDPAVKAEVEEAIEKAGEIGTIVAKASEQPLKEAARVSVSAGTDALSAASSGMIRVGTDILASLPGIGTIFDITRMINDGSKATSAVVEASSEAIEAASDAFIETKENVERGLKELEEKKKMVEEISKRTTGSIKQFENPLQSNIQRGGRKTRRHLFKRKVKSKRVRFAV